MESIIPLYVFPSGCVGLRISCQVNEEVDARIITDIDVKKGCNVFYPTQLNRLMLTYFVLVIIDRGECSPWIKLTTPSCVVIGSVITTPCLETDT